MAKKYILNKKTGKLHKYNCTHCHNSKSIPYEHKFYDTIDEAIIENQHYFSYCKNCFKGE